MLKTIYFLLLAGLVLVAPVRSGPKSNFTIQPVAPAASSGAALGDALAQPVLNRVEVQVLDTLVVYTVHFNLVPPRYLVYHLQKSDRIVLDCFETSLASDSLPVAAQPPVVETRLKNLTEANNIQLVRLILFTRHAVAYEVEEDTDRINLKLKWDWQAEKRKIAQTKKRKRIIYFSAGAAALAGAVAGYLATRPPAANGEEEDIPWPDIRPPDGQ